MGIVFRHPDPPSHHIRHAPWQELLDSGVYSGNYSSDPISRFELNHRESSIADLGIGTLWPYQGDELLLSRKHNVYVTRVAHESSVGSRLTLAYWSGDRLIGMSAYHYLPAVSFAYLGLETPAIRISWVTEEAVRLRVPAVVMTAPGYTDRLANAERRYTHIVLRAELDDYRKVGQEIYENPASILKDPLKYPMLSEAVCYHRSFIRIVGEWYTGYFRWRLDNIQHDDDDDLDDDERRDLDDAELLGIRTPRQVLTDLHTGMRLNEIPELNHRFWEFVTERGVADEYYTTGLRYVLQQPTTHRPYYLSIVASSIVEYRAEIQLPGFYNHGELGSKPVLFKGIPL